jgi:NAD(P)H-nitrite reductase large subunit
MSDEQDPLDDSSTDTSPQSKTEERIRMLARIVCICKGINLAKVLKGLEGSQTVEDVNRKTGCGTGGCRGQRCGPRIKTLLRKKQEQGS